MTFDPADDHLPTFSPDSSQIVFSSERSGAADLYVVNVDGSGLRQITDTSLRESHPSWSINDQIVFNGSLELFWQLYTIAIDGTGQQRLTNSRIDEWSPEWSPDGTRIVFLSERANTTNPGIYVMDIATLNVTLVFDGPNYEWGPIWSADGTQILYSEDQTDGSADIFIMDLNGFNNRRLMERGSYPSWARAITPQ
jgi:Tol biopolymer transport system component